MPRSLVGADVRPEVPVPPMCTGGGGALHTSVQRVCKELEGVKPAAGEEHFGPNPGRIWVLAATLHPRDHVTYSGSCCLDEGQSFGSVFLLEMRLKGPISLHSDNPIT